MFFGFCAIVIFIMGRKRIYNTKAEILESRRRWALNYYHKNKEKCRKQRMKRYYDETDNK